MKHMQEKIPLIVIVGSTASGKSALAEELAGHTSGAIINGDARQIYRELPIITAAPENVAGKFLYSCKSVADPYSFAQYVVDADAVIARVWAAGQVPIVVGGTGLYIDALVHRPVTPPQANTDVRAQVVAMGENGAREFLRAQDPAGYASVDIHNPRRVARAVEIFLQTGKSVTEFRGQRSESPYRVLKIGVGSDVSTEDLRGRINARIAHMWAGGAVAEVQRAFAAGFTLADPGMQTIGVPEIARFLAGEISEMYARELLALHTAQYAKRQKTWLKKDSGIVWYTTHDVLWHLVQNFLQQN